MQPSLINDLDRLQHGVADAWKSIDVATVNGNAVRCRIMQDATANWRVHDDSDEPFYVISGAASLDTEHGTHPLAAGQLLVVPGNAPSRPCRRPRHLAYRRQHPLTASGERSVAYGAVAPPPVIAHHGAAHHSATAKQ